MLDRYFTRPQTIDQIRASWIGDDIERCVVWLAEQRYASRNVFHRVPVLRHFGEFARARGATTAAELPTHVDAFVAAWVAERGTGRHSAEARKKLASEVRGPVEQLLRLVVPGFTGSGRPRWVRAPFPDVATPFFAYLREERGLRETSIGHYLGPLAAAASSPSPRRR